MDSIMTQPSKPATAPPRTETAGAAASKADRAVRRASDDAVAPREKRAIGAETSREEDA